MASPRLHRFVPCSCFSLWIGQARRCQITIAALVTIEIVFGFMERHQQGLKFDYLALGTLAADALIFVATFLTMATICQGILRPMGRCEGSKFHAIHPEVSPDHVHNHIEPDGTVVFESLVKEEVDSVAS